MTATETRLRDDLREARRQAKRFAQERDDARRELHVANQHIAALEAEKQSLLTGSRSLSRKLADVTQENAKTLNAVAEERDALKRQVDALKKEIGARHLQDLITQATSSR